MSKGKKIFKDNTIWVVLIVIIIIAAIVSRNFFTPSNLISIATTESIIGVLCAGAMWCILSKGIDLSAGSMVAFASCICASFVQKSTYSGAMYPGLDLPVIVGIVVAIIACVAFGLLNGLLVAYTKIPPFIATLGTQLIVRAAAQIYTNAYPVPELKDDFKFLGQGYVGPIPMIIIIFAIFIIVSGFMLNYTRFGKNIFAIGGNEQAARAAGIKVEKNQVIVYVWAAFCAGMGGVLLASRSGAGNSSSGLNYELDAIAACTIGGTSQTGGVAKITGVIAGIFILGVVKNIMLLLGVNAYWQQVVKGAIIIIAVVLDMRKNAKKN